MERDYILGTHDPELIRLGVQHRVWRPRVLDFWRREGLGAGQRLLDFGCGPGYATLDLADIVGPSGHVVAVDRSRRFLDALESARATRGYTHVETIEADVVEERLTIEPVDAAWSRWLLIFTPDPGAALANAARAIRPGGKLLLHEYVDYGAWTLSPRSAAFEAFVEAVKRSWSATGGDPDVGLRLPGLLDQAGFEVTRLETVSFASRPNDYLWRWPTSFMRSGAERLVEVGMLSAEDARAAIAAWEAAERDPSAFSVLPTVIEVTAVRR